MLEDYYSKRAHEFEAIYSRDEPARSAELARIARDMRKALRGRDVLEIACGTGYWTALAEPVVQSITATDISPEMLLVASAKGLDRERVRFLRASAYDLDSVPGTFNAGLANFWLSHVERVRIQAFLDSLHIRLGSGARVFMADNMYIEGVGGELIHKGALEDTYKKRKLADGSEYTILKNYFTEDELYSYLAPAANELRITMGNLYWWASYITQ